METIARFARFVGVFAGEPMKMTRIRAVLFEDSGWWCAQCLEYDIAAQARTVPELHDELERVLRAQALVSSELGQEPFAGLPPAPQQFVKMYERARFEVVESGAQTRSSSRANGEVLPIIPTMKLAESWQ